MLDAATDAVMGVLTKQAIAADIRVFEMHKYGETDADHVAMLLGLIDPPLSAKILDVGCGIGEVARLMLEARPDLEISLLNNSLTQLALCPLDLWTIHADMAATGCPDASFDVVMVLYTLGFGKLHDAMREWARVMKPGGLLFIMDLLGPSKTAEKVLGYTTYPLSDYMRAAWEFGFAIDEVSALERGNTDDFMRLAALDGPEVVEACSRIAHHETDPLFLRLVRHG